MAILTTDASHPVKKKLTFAEGQRLAKQKAYEKQAPKKKIKLQELTVFTQQLAAMLGAGIPLVNALDAVQDQTQNPVFKIIVRNVKNEVSAGRTLSEACADYPRAFPKARGSCNCLRRLCVRVSVRPCVRPSSPLSPPTPFQI